MNLGPKTNKSSEGSKVQGGLAANVRQITDMDKISI